MELGYPMGRKERRERELKRDNYATKRSAEKRKHTIIAIAVLGVIGSIVGYSAYTFATMTQEAPGGPEGAGPLGSEHSHAALLIKIFGDKFDFSAPAYQIKSSWIHFEGRDGSTIHKHATGVKLGYLFDTLGIGLDDKCFVFKDGRSFCTNDQYSLKFYINGEKVNDIRDYEIKDNDRILISYGGETQEEIDAQLKELQNQEIIK